MNHRVLILLLFGVIVRHGHAESFDHAIERTQVIARCPLSSNTPPVIFRELREPALSKALLQCAGKTAVDTAVSVILGGDDSGFTVSIHVINANSLPESAIDAISMFVHLRWLGISKKSALILLNEAIHPEPPEGERSAALRRDVPWLHYKHLKPIQSTESVSIYWTAEGRLFAFKDEEISFLVEFAKSEKLTLALAYRVDSKEFDPKIQKLMAQTATAAREKVTKTYGKEGQRSALLYWRELKNLLREQGINWRSPEELNPEISWH
jgi:hypothetical protein